MSSAILQIIIYSIAIFIGAMLLRPSNDKPKVQYMSQEKVINKECVW